MQKFKVDLENCFGIGKLEKEFDFTKSSTILIYASNGTMKSSLAKTMSYFGDRTKEVPCDRFFTEKPTKAELFIDDTLQTENANVFVVDPEDSEFDSSQKISAFVASKDLKKRYDGIYGELEERKTAFIKKLKTASSSTDCEGEFTEAFREDETENFFDLLIKAEESIAEKVPEYKFRYNDVFDQKGNVLKFLKKHQEDLEKYVGSYQALLKESDFFNGSDNSFGTYQANSILKSLEGDAFFDAGHRLELNGEMEIETQEALSETVKTEIEKIVADKDLKVIFDKVDKAIAANAELRKFGKVIEGDNLLLVELADYEAFKKKVWISYLRQIISDVSDLSEFFRSQKAELQEIFDEAKEDLEIWRKLVDTFNSRFSVPFKVSLVNQEDVILKQEGAKLVFKYTDGPDELAECDKELMLPNLSKGEKRAYYILQLLFEVESRRGTNHPLLVCDDVADSFDYKNKYAIIQYLKDLHDSGDFQLLLLTHNFDFYRTVASRLSLRRGDDAVLMTVKKPDRSIELLAGQYVNDVFSHLANQINNKRVFVTLIPFLRNLIEYAGQKESDDYKMLTACLHQKGTSNSIKANDVLAIWQTRFGRFKAKTLLFGETNVIDLTIEAADEILAEGDAVDEVKLENKVALSAAIRLKAEAHMAGKIPGVNCDEFTGRQTGRLFELYENVPGVDGEIINTLGRVLLMTPENIHLNAFMFEPLVDMSVHHLCSLYDEVSKFPD